MILTSTSSLQGRARAGEPADAATEEGKVPLREVQEPGAFFSRPAPPHSMPEPAPDVAATEETVPNAAGGLTEPSPVEASKKTKAAVAEPAEKAGGDE